jgi:hypothetical protein
MWSAPFGDAYLRSVNCNLLSDIARQCPGGAAISAGVQTTIGPVWTILLMFSFVLSPRNQSFRVIRLHSWCRNRFISHEFLGSSSIVWLWNSWCDWPSRHPTNITRDMVRMVGEVCGRPVYYKQLLRLRTCLSKQSFHFIFGYIRMEWLVVIHMNMSRIDHQMMFIGIWWISRWIRNIKCPSDVKRMKSLTIRHGHLNFAWHTCWNKEWMWSC